MNTLSKDCNRCGLSKPVSAFYLTHGKYLMPYCKLCSGQNRTTVIGKAATLLCAARDRAEQKGLDFSLTREWFLERLGRGVCEATGLPFRMNEGRQTRAWGPSVDKIDPAKGYTPENCRMVCWMFNAAKGVSTDQDVMLFAHALINHNKKLTTESVHAH